MVPTIFGSVPIEILNEASVPFFPYFGPADIFAKQLASFSSISDKFLEYFCNTVVNPSITTSCDASFMRRDVNNDNEVKRSSSELGDDVLVTPKNLPLKSTPSSISSLMFTNIVSGKSDHSPAFVM